MLLFISPKLKLGSSHDITIKKSWKSVLMTFNYVILKQLFELFELFQIVCIKCDFINISYHTI